MCLYPRRISEIPGWDTVVPCGQCLECLSARSEEWSVRMVQEASLYKENSFITLTYAEDPVDLNKKHFQDFIKRLRKYLEPRKIRYFLCGEYGGENGRPHGHVIIFNWYPPDTVYFFTKDGIDYYKSATVERIWTHGFVLVGCVNQKTAKYCAKYLQKLDTREHVVEPFTTCSLKPGIGHDAINVESIMSADRIYYHGKGYRTPRYYQKVLEREGYEFEEIKERRLDRCKLHEPTREELAERRAKLRAKGIKKLRYFSKPVDKAKKI